MRWMIVGANTRRRGNTILKLQKWLYKASVWCMAGALALTMSATSAQAETNELWTKAAQKALAEANKVEPEQVKISEWTVVPNDTTALEQEARDKQSQKQAELQAKRQELREAELKLQSVQNELTSIQQATLSQESKALLTETYSKQLDEAKKAVESLQKEIESLENELSKPAETPDYPKEIAYAVASIKHFSYTLHKLVYVDPSNGKVIPEAQANSYQAVKEINKQVKNPDAGWKDSSLNNGMAVTYLLIFLIASYLLLFRTERHSRQSEALIRARGGVHSNTFTA